MFDTIMYGLLFGFALLLIACGVYTVSLIAKAKPGREIPGVGFVEGDDDETV